MNKEKMEELELKMDGLSNIINISEKKLIRYLNKYKKLAIIEYKKKLTGEKSDIKYLINYDHITEDYTHDIAKELLNSLGFHYGGINNVKQLVPQIKIYRSYSDDDLKILAKSINYIKKYMKCIKNENYKVFDIFESTLSEHGVYKLRVQETKDDKFCDIYITSFNRSSLIKTFKTPYQALKEIRSKYYHE